MLDEAFLKICLSLHRLSDVCIYYEHINNFHFVKKAIDPTSLFELEVRRNNIPGGTFSISSDYFSVFVLFIVHFWHVVAFKHSLPDWSKTAELCLKGISTTATSSNFKLFLHCLSIFVLTNIWEKFVQL